jgi:pimeloyl-ACP methyl ester carboxylesterase
MPSPEQLLFLPGAVGNLLFWTPVADRLAYPAPHRFFGWPGFGSVRPDPDVNDFEGLVRLVVKALDQPTAIIAQSMGGVVALRAAIERPDLVTHLVLAATSGGIDMSDFRAADWRPDFFRNHPQVPRWIGEPVEDMSPLLPSVRVPTLLIWGDADPISPVAAGRRLRELLPASRLEVFAGGEHDVATDFAPQVATLIDEHLAPQPWSILPQPASSAR